MRILFSNSGRRTYLVEYCCDLIRQGYKLQLYVSDTNYATPTFYINRKIKKIITPHVKNNEKKYLSAILKVCKQNKIDLLIPCIDNELKILSKNKIKFKKIGTTVLVSNYELISNLVDKKKTEKYCFINKIKYPKSYYNLKTFNYKFPILKKEIQGSSSEGLEILKDKNDLKKLNFNKNILQKIIKGVEINLDILNDLNGKYLHSCAKLKLAMRAGETDKARILNQKKYTTLCRNISKKLKHIGPIDIDVIEDKKNNIFFIDFNPRFGGGYPFTHLAGCNYIKAIIDIFLKKKKNRIKLPKKIVGMKGISLHVSNEKK